MKSIDFIKNTIVSQHDQTDCGVACLLSLIRYYGGNQSLETLREFSGTNAEGTTLLGLYQAANQSGFTAEGNEANISWLIKYGQPVILHVTQEENLNHYIICYGYSKNLFVIGDPAKGIIHYTKKELERLWQSKACLTLFPNETFIKAETYKLDRWRWFMTLLRDDKEPLIFSTFLGLGIALLGMGMAVFSQKLIDNILPDRNTLKLIISIGLLTFILLIRIGLEAIRDMLLIRQTYDFNNRIIDRFYTSLLWLPKLFFDTRKAGELIARLNDTQRIQKVIRSIAGNTVIDILMIIVSFVILFYYSWQAGIIASTSLPVYFFLIYTFNKHIIQAQNQVMQSYAMSESNYITTIQGISAIKNSNSMSFFCHLNKLIYSGFQKKIVFLGKINVKLSTLSNTFSVLFLICILSYTSLMVLNEQMKLGQLMAILSISSSLLPAVSGLALVTIPINEAKIAFSRMYDFAAIEPENKGEISIDNFQLLEVKHLAFRFTGQKQLLKNVSLSVKKGECIAMIGESGCGKSTFIQILQKFYPFESGAVIINKHVGLMEIKTEDWRSIIGVIPQDITLFNGNVIDNLLLPDNNTKSVEKFVSDYGFMPFIQSLPQGLATILGEEGINLSGGQKQLLALMRILYRKPQFLILDEFTSGMDRNTELFTLELLNKLKPKVAILFISHRIYSLKSIADRIYILDKGIVSHFGTHDQLLKTSNFYSDYWKLYTTI